MMIFDVSNGNDVSNMIVRPDIETSAMLKLILSVEVVPFEFALVIASLSVPGPLSALEVTMISSPRIEVYKRAKIASRNRGFRYIGGLGSIGW